MRISHYILALCAARSFYIELHGFDQLELSARNKGMIFLAFARCTNLYFGTQKSYERHTSFAR